MKVLVKQDSATTTPIDCGEGEEGKARLRQLVAEHGSAVTQEDGSPIPPEAVAVPVAAKKKAKAKAKAKRKSTKGKRR